MAHKRKFVLSGVSLTSARVNRHAFRVGPEVMDEIQSVIVSTGYLINAPFTWVGLSLRYGLKNEDKPQYHGIDEKDGELALAIELDSHELQDASYQGLKDRFEVAALKALIDVGQKYQLPYEKFVERLAETQRAKTKVKTKVSGTDDRSPS